MQKLQTVNAETLLYEPLEKPSFVVDSLIPTGLSLFCGSQKIGKSWLMLKLCLCVSQGIPLWDMTTMEGDVLYLCLEDTFCRIQDRLFRLTDEASGRLHFAVASCKLSDGLIVQLEDYLKDYPDSRLIVIDTLQKVRTASKDNAYASDYGDISLIKDFADRHSLAVIVVHHIRKQNDSDVFNKVSGTTGLTGSADATFVLEKEKRASDTAKLYVTGRDTPYQEYTLRFRDCSWELVERKTQEQLAKETIPDVLLSDCKSFFHDAASFIQTFIGWTIEVGQSVAQISTKIPNPFIAGMVYWILLILIVGICVAGTGILAILIEIKVIELYREKCWDVITLLMILTSAAVIIYFGEAIKKALSVNLLLLFVLLQGAYVGLRCYLESYLEKRNY